jgi:hypothetical protein
VVSRVTGQLALPRFHFSGKGVNRDLGIEPTSQTRFAQILQQRLEIFQDDWSNFGPAVRLYSEGGATARPEDHYRKRRNG